MKRDSADYVIRGRIERLAGDRYSVIVVAESAGSNGDKVIEKAASRTRAEAKIKQWELIRIVAHRLEAAGNKVVQVEADPLADNGGEK
ncbi:MAG: hypothetical protein ACM3X5_03300 [Bacillota bacterium]